MGCNCGRKKLQVTSANIASTAGKPTAGARETAKAKAAALVAAAREVLGDSNSGDNK